METHPRTEVFKKVDTIKGKETFGGVIMDVVGLRGDLLHRVVRRHGRCPLGANSVPPGRCAVRKETALGQQLHGDAAAGEGTLGCETSLVVQPQPHRGDATASVQWGPPACG